MIIIHDALQYFTSLMAPGDGVSGFLRAMYVGPVASISQTPNVQNSIAKR